MAIAGDTFVEGTDTALSAHTPTGPNAGAGWSIDGADPTVLAATDNVADEGAGRANMTTDLGDDEMDVSVELTNATAADGNAVLYGPRGRCTADPADVIYEAYYNWITNEWTLDDGLAPASDTAAEAWPGGTVTMLLQIRNSDVRLFVNGTEKCSLTTNSGAGNTRSGLLFGAFSGTQRMRFDNFQAQSAPAAAPSVNPAILGVRLRRGRPRDRRRRQALAIGRALPTTPAAGATLSAGTHTITLSAPTATRLAGAVALAAAGQTVTLTVPTATLTVGAVTLPAGTATITLSIPTATLLQAGTLPAGVQTVTLSAPAVTVQAGAVTRAAGAQTVTLSAPAARVGYGLGVSGQTVTVIAPSAVLLAGAAIVPVGACVITMTLPAVRISGGIELPDIVEALLLSRMPDRTLGSRLPDRTLEAG
jgi:hypothetical protein